ncbi:MAG: OmpA family protein [Flavobacteriales bacterium]|nr:OmpA family protein [Flavobacteriales bacterium]
MKALLLFAIGLLSLARPTFSQSTPPSLGPSLTLSNGQCAEVIPADTLRRIGRHAYSTVTGKAYRFSFQGQEKDDDLHGAAGTNYAFEFRMYDSRAGRFLSTDPLSRSYPGNSPYAFAENDVIRSIDVEGLEKYIVVRKYYDDINYKTNIVEVPSAERVRSDRFIVVVNIHHNDRDLNLLGGDVRRQLIENAQSVGGNPAHGRFQPIGNLNEYETDHIADELTGVRPGIKHVTLVPLPFVDIPFDTDLSDVDNLRSNITETDKTNLRRLSKLLNAPDMEPMYLDVGGHTSDIATRYGSGELTTENNNQLSQDRACTGEGFAITDFGIPSNKVTSQGHGSSKPIDGTNRSDRKNQRASFSIKAGNAAH